MRACAAALASSVPANAAGSALPHLLLRQRARLHLLLQLLLGHLPRWSRRRQWV